LNCITTEKLTAQELVDHIAVGSSEYSSPEVVNPDHVAWKHLDNPYGPSVSVSLRKESGELVGHSFLQPRMFCIGHGQVVSGATITDLVIVPAERIAAALIGMTRMAKSVECFDVVLHTSNHVSDVIYRKLFKFPVACTLVASALPLRVANALAAHVPIGWLRDGLDILVAPWRWLVKGAAALSGTVGRISFGVEPAASVADEIFEDFKGHAGPHFERNTAFLDWRFREGPVFKGQLLWVWCRRQCLGYIAVRKVSINGFDVLVVLDSVLRRPLNKLESVSVQLLCAREAVQAHCDAVFCLANQGNDALRWWSEAPFIRIPDSYLPHPTPIFVHTKGRSVGKVFGAGVFLTLADLDYF